MCSVVCSLKYRSNSHPLYMYYREENLKTVAFFKYGYYFKNSFECNKTFWYIQKILNLKNCMRDTIGEEKTPITLICIVFI